MKYAYSKNAVSDKVILRFRDRWWPKVPGGILKWYDYSNDAADEVSDGIKTMSWVEWVDLTDGIGSPVIVAFLCGDDAIRRWHSGRSDREVAFAATRALERLAYAVTVASSDQHSRFHHK